MQKPSTTIKELTPYLFGAIVIVLCAYLYLHMTQPQENLLPDVYGVM